MTAYKSRESRLVFAAIITAWCLLAAIVITGGCGCASAPSPIQQVVAAREIRTATLAGLNSAHRLGILTIEQKQQLEPYRLASLAAADAMEKEALAGGTNEPFSAFTRAAQAFQAAINELLRAKLESDRIRAAVVRTQAVRPAPVPSDDPGLTPAP